MNPQTASPVSSLHSAVPPAVTDVELRAAVDLSGPVRLGLGIVAAGAGLFVLWAAFAPLDEGVVAPAQVAIESGRRVIQHQFGGVVTKVHVKEGQRVKAGDLLLELDSGTLQANVESVMQTYYAQRATESRLQAELSGAREIQFHPDLLAPAARAAAAQHIENQRTLFTSRTRAHAAEQAATRSAIVALNTQAEGLRAALVQRQAQVKAMEEQTAFFARLTDEGFAPRTQLLQHQQALAEVRSTTAQMRGEEQRLGASASELEHRTQQQQQSFLRDASAQLAEVRREVQALKEKLSAARQETARAQLIAPVDGQVVGLAIGEVGGVATEGQRILEIVPSTPRIFIDAKVPPQAIDRVATGNRVHARFSTFAHAPMLVVDAEVKEISGDLLTEAVGNQVNAFYRARVEVSPEGTKALAHRRLHPGMQAEILIQTGERTLLTYLLSPLLRRMQGAMKEE